MLPVNMNALHTHPNVTSRYVSHISIAKQRESHRDIEVFLVGSMKGVTGLTSFKFRKINKKTCPLASSLPCAPVTRTEYSFPIG